MDKVYLIEKLDGEEWRPYITLPLITGMYNVMRTFETLLVNDRGSYRLTVPSAKYSRL